MKKLVVPAAVLAGLVMTSPVALAQDEPADCAAAIVALNAADADHRAAVAADEAAAEARAADDALERAEDRLADAEEARTLAAADVDARQLALNATAPGTPERERAQAALDEAREVLADADAAVADRREERDDARDIADDTDADALQDTADETDAAALKTVLDEARADFDRLCGGVTTTPPPAPVDLDCDDFPLSNGRSAQDELAADLNDPHALDKDGDGVACEADDPAAGGNDPDADGDVDVEVVVPNGGVATGGGPA